VERDDRHSDVRLDRISGIVSGLSTAPESNTATAALLSLQENEGIRSGFRVSIRKGIPLAAGLGGSAASAVAAVTAANALLPEELPLERLLRYALDGEAVASASRHADNVAPSLYGGLVGVMPGEVPRAFAIPIPRGLRAVIVHPDLQVKTADARAVLRSEIPLSLHVEQTALLSAFLAGCFLSDVDLVRLGLRDLVVEPQRQHTIPGFKDVQRAAIEAGALGSSISGAGPSVFALVTTETIARSALQAMVRQFDAHGVGAEGWITRIARKGARIVRNMPRQ
jgi:homoserine kinase